MKIVVHRGDFDIKAELLPASINEYQFIAMLERCFKEGGKVRIECKDNTKMVLNFRGQPQEVQNA